MISGVCGGIAEYYALDPTLIRLLAVLAAVVSFGGVVLVYLVMSIVVPESPEPDVAQGGAQMPQADSEAQPSPTTATPLAVPLATSGAAASVESAVAPHPEAPPPPPPTVASSDAAAPESAHRRHGGGIVFGVVLVFLGLALLASQFVPGLELWKLWPLVLVAIGLNVMFRGGRP